MATDINAQGDIVGYYIDSSGRYLPFLLQDGIYTTIHLPVEWGAFASVGSGVNERGDIVGHWGIGGTEAHGFLFQKGAFVRIEVPGFDDVEPGGLNAPGYWVFQFQTV